MCRIFCVDLCFHFPWVNIIAKSFPVYTRPLEDKVQCHQELRTNVSSLQANLKSPEDWEGILSLPGFPEYSPTFLLLTRRWLAALSSGAIFIQ